MKKKPILNFHSHVEPMTVGSRQGGVLFLLAGIPKHPRQCGVFTLTFIFPSAMSFFGMIKSNEGFDAVTASQAEAERMQQYQYCCGISDR